MPLWNPFSVPVKLSLTVFVLLYQLEAVAQARKKIPVASCKNKVQQGVSGLVFEVHGNQMPAPGKGVPLRKGVQREFGIFLPASLSTAVKSKEDCFFKKPGSKLVSRARTGKDGCFNLALMPGRYSIFVKEKGLWYANSFGGDGEICQFEVFADSVTHVDFRINHGAWY
jgi:hypothetical protein